MRNFGFVDYDTVDYIGTNGKMDELAAAMGLTSLDAADAIVAHNIANFDRYRSALDGMAGVHLREPADHGAHNHQYVVAEIDEQACGLHRDHLIRLLWADNVRARRYFWPGVHRMEPYATLYPDAGSHLPVTTEVADRVLVLPTGLAVDEPAIDDIGSILRLAVDHAGAVRAQAGIDATAPGATTSSEAAHQAIPG
jgi:dTDP-4-amino-4,6-dideoxygalactose transaminase